MKLEQVAKLAQQQTLSPRIMLSMKMLPLTTTELELQIARELEENPALEWVEKPLQVEAKESAPDALEHKLQIFKPFQDSQSGSQGSGEQDDYMAFVPAKAQGLTDHLEAQLQLVELPAQVRAAAQEIIGNLDKRGFLVAPKDVLRAAFSDGLAPVFDEGLAAVQNLDPAGIGAEDLRECLLIQLKREGREDSMASEIVDSHFQLLIKNKLPRIAEKMHTTVAAIKAELETLEHLSFQPGAEFGNDPNETIHPDIILEEGSQGYQLDVVNERVPKLTLSESFQKLLAQKDLDAETKAFLKKKLDAAQWIIQAIEGRSRTLKTISQAILEYQPGFLKGGPERIKPLKMQTIADAVGVHVSTISRTLKGKYMQTPWGVVSLRSFFGGGIENASGKLTATHTLKERIAGMVEREDKGTPLSDGQIADKLKAQGFQISRRTVSKYRSHMNIPPANLRKTY